MVEDRYTSEPLPTQLRRAPWVAGYTDPMFAAHSSSTSSRREVWSWQLPMLGKRSTKFPPLFSHSMPPASAVVTVEDADVDAEVVAVLTRVEVALVDSVVETELVAVVDAVEVAVVDGEVTSQAKLPFRNPVSISFVADTASVHSAMVSTLTVMYLRRHPKE